MERLWIFNCPVFILHNVEYESLDGLNTGHNSLNCPVFHIPSSWWFESLEFHLALRCAFPWCQMWIGRPAVFWPGDLAMSSSHCSCKRAWSDNVFQHMCVVCDQVWCMYIYIRYVYVYIYIYTHIICILHICYIYIYVCYIYIYIYYI